MSTNGEEYFALDMRTGKLVHLGNFGDIEAAEEVASELCEDPIWIVGEEDAKDWIASLCNGLSILNPDEAKKAIQRRLDMYEDAVDKLHKERALRWTTQKMLEESEAVVAIQRQGNIAKNIEIRELRQRIKELGETA